MALRNTSSALASQVKLGAGVVALMLVVGPNVVLCTVKVYFHCPLASLQEVVGKTLGVPIRMTACICHTVYEFRVTLVSRAESLGLFVRLSPIRSV